MVATPSFAEASRRPAAWIALALFWAAFAYLWVWPWFRPRGEYLWGHVQLRDIYFGIPIAAATLCSTIVICCRARARRSVALRLAAVTVPTIALLFIFDAVYTFGYLKIWRTNYYFDLAKVSRRYNAIDEELGFKRLARVSWRGRKSAETGEVYFRTDENGFRNPPGIERADVVFIGDSYTEAAELPEEQTFVRRVAQATGLRAVNLGVGAYGPQQEEVVLRRYALAYRPRVIVWQLFEGNDLLDAQGYAKWRESPTRPYLPLAARYFNNSLINEWFARTRLRAPERNLAPATIHYTDGTVRELFIRYPYLPDQPVQKVWGFEETKRALEAGTRLCRERGIELLVVHVPVMVRVMAPFVTFAREADRGRFLPGEVVQSEGDFESELGRFCHQIGCSYIGLFPVFRQEAARDNRGLYIPTDEHLDARGHAIVARTIGEWLAQSNELNYSK